MQHAVPSLNLPKHTFDYSTDEDKDTQLCNGLKIHEHLDTEHKGTRKYQGSSVVHFSCIFTQGVVNTHRLTILVALATSHLIDNRRHHSALQINLILDAPASLGDKNNPEKIPNQNLGYISNESDGEIYNGSEVCTLIIKSYYFQQRQI